MAVHALDLEQHVTPVALPAIADIPAGFDCIWQVRSDHLNNQLSNRARDLLGSRAGYFEVQSSELSAAVREEIARRVTANFTSTINLDPISIDSTWDQVTSFLFRVRTLGASLSFFSSALSLPSANAPIVRFSMLVEIGVPEAQPGNTGTPTGITVEVGGGTPSGTSPSTVPITPPPVGTGSGGSGLRFIPVAGGKAFVHGTLDVLAHPDLAQCRPRLRFLDSSIAFDNVDVVFAALPNVGLTDATAEVFEPLSWSEFFLTPRFAAIGTLRTGEATQGIQSFRVQVVAGAANTPGHEVLSLCANVGPTNEVGDPALVRPFVGDRELAAFVSERIVEAGVRIRWIRRDTPKSFVGDFPLDLLDDEGNTIPVIARIRFTIVSLSRIALSAPPASNLGDRIRLRGAYRIHLLHMVRNGKVYRGSDLGDLEDPITEPFEIHIDPFGPGSAGTGMGDQFIYDIAGRLVEPLYRPFADSLALTLPAGKASAAVGGIVQRWSFT